VGFYLSAHPLDSRGKQFQNLGISSFTRVETEMQSKSAGLFQMAGVLLKKQEKVSQKGNKYAFLQLSDPTGIFEVTLFSELLHASREYLEPGQALLLTVEAEQREDQMRFTTTRIEPLDKALEGKIREIQVHLASSQPAKKIKEFLDIEGKGAAEISLHVRVDGNRIAHIKLPGRWSLSQQARNIIRTQDGVLEISEG
jgi:DNA polymerase-3 subunit alpha